MKTDGYPAYSILRTGDEEFRISLAVRGFNENEIAVETREGSVWISGNREVDPSHNEYLYRVSSASARQSRGSAGAGVVPAQPAFAGRDAA